MAGHSGALWRTKTMHRTRIRPTQVLNVLRSLHADSKLVRIVTKLTREVERLDEDNAQLYASVLVYKEVLRRQCAGTGPAASPSNAPSDGRVSDFGRRPAAAGQWAFEMSGE